MKIFGFELNKKEVKSEPLPSSPLAPTDVDKGAVTAKQSLGFDFNYTFENDAQQIKEYKRIASNAEAQEAIEEIVNDCIVFSKDGSAVTVSYDDGVEKITTNIKTKINDEFNYVLELLKFNEIGDDLFKEWYIVGRQSYHLVLDEKRSTIADIRLFDPLTISKKTEILKEKDKNGIEVVKSIETFYEYMENPNDPNAKEKIRFSDESIVQISSGMKDEEGRRTVSHLHSAIRPFNQLVMLEDSMVVFYVSRAPERRVYYIDVGQLPKTKADEYMRSVVAEQKNNIVYDSATGTVKDNKHIMSVMEDIFIPRREGCFQLNTKIKLLDGRDVELCDLIEDHNNGIQNWTYSVCKTTGKIIPGLISWAGVTRKDSELLKVTLDNDEEIICTLDHKFILRSGELIEAQYLKEFDSLMPLYTNEDGLVYESPDVSGSMYNGDYSKANYPDYKLPKNYNHKVAKIEFLNYTEDVGTLTIDADHILHDEHNFSLTAGVFVMNSSATSIESLSNNADWNMEGVEYLRRKMYKALKVPMGRLEQDSSIGFGRQSEITRDELKFDKFKRKLQNRFSMLFRKALLTQLVLKKIITTEEVTKYSQIIGFEYNVDMHFEEQKRLENLNGKLEVLRDASEYEGKYYSRAYIRKNLLQQSDVEIKELDKEIETEKKAGLYDED